MRIGLRVPPCAPVGRIAETAREAERAGFDEVWFPDSQLLWRDVFAVLTAAAAATSRITLGTAVTNLVTRHPAVVASAARTVAEAAPGRFLLGVGVGDSSVAPIGLRPSTGAELRDRLGVVRDLLAGRAVDFDGVTSRLRDPVDVPVYLAASGPRNLRLAGELADGAILLSGVSPAPLAAATAKVQEGAAAAGRARVPMTVSAFCRVTDDVERAARELKPVCARIAQNGGAGFLALAGVRVDVPERLPGVYPDLVHAEDWAAAVKVCDPYVSDEAATAFAREFCLYGTPSEIVERLAGVGEAGADAVFLQHVGSYDLPHALLADVAGRVMPLMPRTDGGR
ncbi:LLM class flavin-dependent oxidoreductase [Streptomyces sp. NBC_01754]|uniref:LLM class flavin-dependent oxidoreductase n=1 Tax=Streptomyces sp. NBC_01754 TaxID=2975930 RepID=UPI002DD91F5E|nr:LLM class flavin-dependent oxidoreductase [Streptomyces sp. NBC_01754]WSC93502.1 LLM class flavin-dependent oxidoreductase [Streptomyces sp. NBC_01754]